MLFLDPPPPRMCDCDFVPSQNSWKFLTDGFPSLPLQNCVSGSVASNFREALTPRLYFGPTSNGLPMTLNRDEALSPIPHTLYLYTYFKSQE